MTLELHRSRESPAPHKVAMRQMVKNKRWVESLGTEHLDAQMLPPPRAAYKQFLGQETED